MRLNFGVKPWSATEVIKTSSDRELSYQTDLGRLYEGDCLDIFSVDTLTLRWTRFFADPLFNLGKKYGSATDDDKPDCEYVEWCKKWVDESIRVLKPGGAPVSFTICRSGTFFSVHTWLSGG